MEPMRQEDLAAIEKLNEETISQELYQRLKQGNFYTFVGDVLLALNPNEDLLIFDKEVNIHIKNLSTMFSFDSVVLQLLLVDLS